jgi:syntaxin 1B/2/3
VRVVVQVNRAVEHVHRGETQLQQAKKIGRSTRKWMCVALIIFLVIAGIIVLATLQPWKSKK